MKKPFVTIVSSVIVFMMLFSFVACTKHDNEQKNDPEEQKQLFEYEEITPMGEDLKASVLALCYEKYVRVEHPEQTISDLKIDYDMGNRNGNYVFIFSDAREYDNSVNNRGKEIVKSIPYHSGGNEYAWNIGYRYENGRPMRVYNNGAVYGFTEAFENGLLSEGDMEYFLQCHAFVTEGKKMQKRMDKAKENELMIFVSDLMNKNDNSTDFYCKYSTRISCYLGTYRNNVVFGLTGELQNDIGNEKEITIDGVTIRQKAVGTLCVYTGDELCFLEIDYKSGLLTKEELVLISDRAGSDEVPIYNVSYFVY